MVVTRAEGPGGRLGSAFASAGARVLRIPTVEIGPPRDPKPMDRAVERLADYDWLVFTSSRAVDALADRIDALAGEMDAPADRADAPAGQRDAPPGQGDALAGTGDALADTGDARAARADMLPASVRIAAVGPSTADRAREAGFPVRSVGDGSGGEALARRLVAEGVGEGSRVLFPTSSRGRRELEEVLAEAGAVVDRVVAYETTIRTFDPVAVPRLRDADVVTFTSPSAVEGWHSAMGDDFARFLSPSVRYVVIGGTTGAAATEAGIEVVEAGEASFEGMVHAVLGLAREGDRETGM